MNAALNSYQTARTSYNATLSDYKNASHYSDRPTIKALAAETYMTTKAIAQALKDTKDFWDLVNDTLSHASQRVQVPAALTTQEANLQTYMGTVNTHLSDLLNANTTIKNDEDAIVNASSTIAEKTAALAKLQSGTDPLDINSAQLTITQRQNALTDAEQTLADYYVRAPFDGVIATVAAKKGDAASQGSALATIITQQRIADISLNEVDVARAKVGAKATLTFDAIPGLTVTGQVAQIDTIGTVTQGVVNYNVEIKFDVQDDRVKPGMSVSAAIVTAVAQDVLTVPNSAVKTQSGTHYVEVLSGVSSSSVQYAGAQGIVSAVAPSRVEVQTGAVNDSLTEITGGLSEGDLVVVRTLASSTQSSPTTSGGGLRIPGLGGGARGG